MTRRAKKPVTKSSRFTDPASAVTVYDSTEAYLASFDEPAPSVTKLAGNGSSVKSSSTSDTSAAMPSPKLFSDILKNSPTPADVHTPSADLTDGNRKKKPGKGHDCSGPDCAVCASGGKYLMKFGHKDTLASGLADLSARADATSEAAHAASTSAAHEEAESLHRRAAYAHEEFGSDTKALKHRRKAEEHSKLGRQLRMVSKAMTFDEVLAKGNPNHDKATGRFASGKGSVFSTPAGKASKHTQHALSASAAARDARSHGWAADVHQNAAKIHAHSGRVELAAMHKDFARTHRAEAKRYAADPTGGGVRPARFDEKAERASRSRARNAARMKREREKRMKKSADATEFNHAVPFKIVKLDEEKRMVYGFASVSSIAGVEITDVQDDVLDMAELTKAAHDFMRHSRNGGEMHQTLGTGEVVESLMIDADAKAALGITRPEEGWFIGYHVTSDSVWKDVKGGKYGSFSIGGTGRRVPVTDTTDSE